MTALPLDGGVLRLTAGPKTDYFIDPAGKSKVHNAPRLLTTPPDGDWQLSAKVTVDFNGTYDAGVLMLWADETHWAKLCFELSPMDGPMIVSVITREVSDDANAWKVPTNTAWLRISCLDGVAYAFHASEDGQRWSFVRYFALAGAGPEAHAGGLEVGVVAQAPMGDGCEVTFEHLSLTQTRLADLRDGS